MAQTEYSPQFKTKLVLEVLGIIAPAPLLLSRRERLRGTGRKYHP